DMTLALGVHILERREVERHVTQRVHHQEQQQSGGNKGHAWTSGTGCTALAAGPLCCPGRGGNASIPKWEDAPPARKRTAEPELCFSGAVEKVQTLTHSGTRVDAPKGESAR